jgi:hypothetical protein
LPKQSVRPSFASSEEQRAAWIDDPFVARKTKLTKANNPGRLVAFLTSGYLIKQQMMSTRKGLFVAVVLLLQDVGL